MTKILLLINKPIGDKILTDLIKNNANIVGVVTRPNADSNWWGHDYIHFTTQHHKIPMFHHHDDVNVEFDVGFSVQYDHIMDQKFIDKATKYIINLHAAELPRYRGCNSTAHAIINAKKDNYYFAGATLHYIDHRIDTGKVIHANVLPFDEHTTNKELYTQIEDLCFDIYEYHRDFIINGEKMDSSPQREAIDKDTPSYYYYRNSLDNKQIIIGVHDIDSIWAITRALYFPPFPPAWIYMSDNKRCEITPTIYDTAFNENETVIRVRKAWEIVRIITQFPKIKFINLGNERYIKLERKENG